MQKFNFDYDSGDDNLFLYNPKSKSKGSVELGDFILDYNNKKQLVGIQIIKASKLLKDIVNEKEISIKKILSELISCKVEIKPKNNLLVVKIFLMSKFKELSPVIPIPSIRESSPALAYS